MAEEFQESEVFFSDRNLNHRLYFFQDGDDDDNSFDYHEAIMTPEHRSWEIHHHGRTQKNETKKMASSAPVRIPGIMFNWRTAMDEFEEECEGGEMEPPHVIVGRRIAGKMAFSVCTGNGRTLKGRDLSEVRNSILRMTGFLES